MKIFVLGSGSNGNATLITNGDNKILIDCGVGINKLKERLKEIDVPFESITDILVTHEHTDHIKSLKYFSTANLYGECDVEGIIPVNDLEEFDLNGFKVTPIPLSHDASYCLGFVIKDDHESLVYITDTGYIKNKYYQYISNKTHYIIESNYDVSMLVNSSRPQYLISRIMSNKGHLGNIDCANIMKDLIGNETKTITLAHLSGDCNTSKVALDTFLDVMKENYIDLSNIKLSCASREHLVIVKGVE